MVVVITPTDELQPRVYWMAMDVLEEGLATFEPGEFFADDVTEMVANLPMSGMKRHTS